MPESPSNHGFDRAADPCKTTVADLPSDMLLFDGTPLPSRRCGGDISDVTVDGSDKAMSAAVSSDLPKFDDTPLPAPSGLPKLDDTPLLAPRPDGGDSITLLGVGGSGLPSVDHTLMFPLPSVARELDSSIAPGERTAGPLFDVTPLHKVQDVPVDATVSPVPEW